MECLGDTRGDFGGRGDRDCAFDKFVWNFEGAPLPCRCSFTDLTIPKIS